MFVRFCCISFVEAKSEISSFVSLLYLISYLSICLSIRLSSFFHTWSLLYEVGCSYLINHWSDMIDNKRTMQPKLIENKLSLVIQRGCWKGTFNWKLICCQPKLFCSRLATCINFKNRKQKHTLDTYIKVSNRNNFEWYSNAYSWCEEVNFVNYFIQVTRSIFNNKDSAKNMRKIIQKYIWLDCDR